MSGKKFKSLILIIPLSFLLGLAWGTHLIEKQKAIDASKEKNKIRILANAQLFTPQLLHEFENKNGIDVIVQVPETEEEFFSLSMNNTNKFDLIILRQENINLLLETGKVKGLDWSKIKNSALIAPDFVNLSSAFGKKLLPLYWNVMGYVLLSAKKSLFEENFRDILMNPKYRGKLSLYPNSIDLYTTLKNLNLIAENWFEMDQTEKIKQAIDHLEGQKVEFNKVIDLTNIKESGLWASQQPHTSALKLVNGNDLLEYWLPPQKATLNLDYVALIEGAVEKSAYLFLNYISEKATTFAVINHSPRATVFDFPVNDQVLPYQTPQFLRTIPLGRLYSVEKHYGHHKEWVSLTKGFLVKPNQDL